MSLIPLLLGRLSGASAAVSAAAPGRYDPGAGHRPAAAIVAAGLPAALLVAVALSPFTLPPKTIIDDPDVFHIPTAPIPPPPEPKEPPVPQRESTLKAPPTLLPPISQNPADPVPDPIPIPTPTDSGVGTAPSTPVDSTPVILPLIEAKLDPRFKNSFQPDYPPFEQRNEIEGTARVRVLVGTDGRVKAVEDVATSSPGFFAETRRRALAKWRFKPATRGGTAEESWVVMTVRFKLTL